MSPIGIGTWQWGNQFLWKYDSKNDGQLRETYDFLKVQKNIWFDTAEVYGKDSRSETLIGQFSQQTNGNIPNSRPLILTKFAPSVSRIGPESVVQVGMAMLVPASLAPCIIVINNLCSIRRQAILSQD